LVAIYIDASKLEEAAFSEKFKKSEAVFLITDSHNIPGFTSNLRQQDLDGADAVDVIFAGYNKKVKVRRYNDNFEKVI